MLRLPLDSSSTRLFFCSAEELLAIFFCLAEELIAIFFCSAEELLVECLHRVLGFCRCWHDTRHGGAKRGLLSVKKL